MPATHLSALMHAHVIHLHLACILNRNKMVKHIAFFRCLRHIVQNDQVKQKQLQMGGKNFRSCDDPACWTQIAPFVTNSSKLVLSKKKCSNWHSYPKSARFLKKWSTETLSTLFCTVGGPGYILFRTYPLLSDAESYPDIWLTSWYPTKSLCWDDRSQKQRISFILLTSTKKFLRGCQCQYSKMPGS